MDRREEAVFEALARENEVMLLAFLRTFVFDPGQVEDLFQETLITAWRRFDDYDPGRPLGPWLRGIAMNLARNAGRQRQREPLVFGEASMDAIQGYFDSAELSREARLEQLGVLSSCLEQVSSKGRELLRLRYEQQKNASEIGELIGQAAASVRKRLQRVRQVLADCVGRKMEVNS